MAKQLHYLALLQSTIQEMHRCDAAHCESVHVHETVDGQTIWQGDVEVFDLDGHAEAKRCYAWTDDQELHGARFVSVLERPPVDSAAMAVRAAIFFDVQPAQHISLQPAMG